MALQKQDSESSPLVLDNGYEIDIFDLEIFLWVWYAFHIQRQEKLTQKTNHSCYFSDLFFLKKHFKI